VDEQVEVLSLLGDITFGAQNERKIHAHIVLGKADGTAHGGHLLEGWIRPTLEIILQESPEYLARKTDEATGLPLIQL
jgi:predicted DNA-binding protein with PD1-like motif